MGDRAPETERLTGRCLAMTLSGARLNGDFSLPSQLPIWTWSAPGTRLHDAIEAVKPLSPPDSWGDFVVADIGLGTVVRIAALYMVPSPMENSMCWEMDYRFFAEQKKAQETRIKEEQRAGVIDKLLSEANKQSESTNATPVKEVAPAK